MAAIPYLDKAFIDATPVDREDGLVVDEFDVDGGKKDMIVKLAQEIADNKHGSFDSLLVAHKNKLIFESYYLRGRINLPHPQASATKRTSAPNDRLHKSKFGQFDPASPFQPKCRTVVIGDNYSDCSCGRMMIEDAMDSPKQSRKIP